VVNQEFFHDVPEERVVVLEKLDRVNQRLLKDAREDMVDIKKSIASIISN